MPLITLPKIPNLPGVPSLPGLGQFQKSMLASTLGAIQGAMWRAVQTKSVWGIYDKKGKHLGYDPGAGGILTSITQSLGLEATMSMGSIEFSKESKISDFPVEKGSFASYNKVEMPSNPTVVLNFQGSESQRQAFLVAMQKAVQSNDLYDIATPEVKYIDQCIESYSYSRSSSHGCTLLSVSIRLKAVRQVSSQYTTKKVIDAPKEPSAASTVGASQVQPKKPDISIAKALVDKIPAFASKAGEYISQWLK